MVIIVCMLDVVSFNSFLIGVMFCVVRLSNLFRMIVFVGIGCLLCGMVNFFYFVGVEINILYL